MKKYNFGAGPGILPDEVISAAAQSVIDFNGSSLSLLEISHRSPAFEAVMEEAEQLVRELLAVDDSYGVMFLTGGASTQFFMAPMNLLPESGKAAYIDTGVWSSKAIKEAKIFGQIETIASSKDKNYNFIPKDFIIPNDAKYLHYTSNNTIYGTEFHHLPKTDIPLVCDMSSDIFSRPLNGNDFGLIYAGAQKNMGPAGTTLVVVKKDLLGKTGRTLPSMLDYGIHIANGSMYNTPPVFPIYVAMLTMRWIKSVGGLSEMQQRNQAKAALLYGEIDLNPMFVGTAEKSSRSMMNVCFLLQDSSLEQSFVETVKNAGIEGIKGHRLVGGFRASIYNALPLESVQVLVNVMQDFAKTKA